jgi:hypothetical protein
VHIYIYIYILYLHYSCTLLSWKHNTSSPNTAHIHHLTLKHPPVHTHTQHTRIPLHAWQHTHFLFLLFSWQHTQHTHPFIFLFQHFITIHTLHGQFLANRFGLSHSINTSFFWFCFIYIHIYYYRFCYVHIHIYTYNKSCLSFLHLNIYLPIYISCYSSTFRKLTRFCLDEISAALISFCCCQPNPKVTSNHIKRTSKDMIIRWKREDFLCSTR